MKSPRARGKNYYERRLFMYSFVNKEFVVVLQQPLIRTEIIRGSNRDGYISGVIAVELSDLIDGNHENLMDLFSEKLIGSVCLSDITFRIVGCSSCNEVLIEVTGHADEIEEEIGEVADMILPDKFTFINTQNVFAADVIYQAEKANEHGDYRITWGWDENKKRITHLAKAEWYTSNEVMIYIRNGWWVIIEEKNK